MYNKLFTKILDSTIWLEPDSTRLVWITFLAVMDEDGFVALSSVGNVAARARVSPEDAERAVRALESPDSIDSAQEHEGKRIERVPYGWMVLNAGKYRELIRRETAKEQTRARVARHRERHRNAGVTQANEKLTTSVAVAVSETSKSKAMSGKPDVVPPKSRDNSQTRQQALDVLAFLNEKTGRHYQPVPANVDRIAARLKQGATIDDCRAVIAKKCREWARDDKMAQFLRPATLFNAEKFAQYQGELGPSNE